MSKVCWRRHILGAGEFSLAGAFSEMLNNAIFVLFFSLRVSRPMCVTGVDE